MSLEFTVPDMCCNGCVNAITKIVQTLDSAASVKADLAVKKLSIETAATKENVAAALEKGGFPPE